MDNKLARLDSIQTSVNGLNSQIQNMDKTINVRENKFRDTERSREFDSDILSDMSKQQNEFDSIVQEREKYQDEQKQTENASKVEIQELKCRSMRENLLFHKISEEKDENCQQKVLQFMENNLKIENATQDIRLQRVHRVGPYRSDKTRPIVAKFASFPQLEMVRRAARELKRTNFGISEQFPKEVVDQRRKLIPIMLQARKDWNEAFLKVDKLYIDNRLYHEKQ